MNFSFLDPWHLFLPREAGHVIGLMGSGGKTSLQKALGQVYREDQVPVFQTCTTRTEPWPDVSALSLGELSDKDPGALPPVLYLHDGADAEGKWRGLPPEAVDSLEERFPDRVILVEVDGAAKLPLKLHQPGEPVWPRRTSLALVVMGGSSVGSFVHTSVHRLGRVASPVFDPLPEGALVTWDHLLDLLVQPGGYLDQVPASVPAVLAVAGMGEVADSIGLFDFVDRAMQHPRLPITVFCETEGERPGIRAGCRLEEPEPGDA